MGDLRIGRLLEGAAASHPDAVALTLGPDQRTFADLDSGANRTANALRGLGVAAGQRIAWWAGPSLRTVEGFAAAAKLGTPFAALPPGATLEEAATALELLAPRLLVADGHHAEAAAAVGENLGVDTVVVEAGPTSGLDDLDTRSAAASDRGVDGPGPAASDPHVIYLTSGTTGAPKGVVVSHRASWLRASPGAGTFSRGIRGPGGILTNFPLYHYGGWHYVLESWQARRPLHLIHRADGDAIVETVAEQRPAALYFIPAVWDRVLDALPAELDLGFVGHADTGTSAAPPELLARIGTRLPAATTSVLYGSSEAGHHTTLHPEDLATRPGSVGRAAPPIELEVDDHGEVLVGGPTVMDGYLDRPDLTAAVLAGGWYHTGDLGHLDDGYLYITGRRQELIRTGGEWVAPTEVELCLRSRPELADVAVVGLPDPRWGQVVCAVVVPAAGAPVPDVGTLRSWLDGRLARHKHPRRVVGVDGIPRTPVTGQIQRTLIETRLVGGGNTGATRD